MIVRIAATTATVTTKAVPDHDGHEAGSRGVRRNPRNAAIAAEKRKLSSRPRKRIINPAAPLISESDIAISFLDLF